MLVSFIVSTLTSKKTLQYNLTVQGVLCW